MDSKNKNQEGKFIHLVTLSCKDGEHASQCLQALENYGKPDAFSFSCKAYEFGLKTGSSDTVYIVERWNRWSDLDALLNAKVIPALPMYNQLLKTPFNPTTDTLRIDLSLD